VSKLRRPFLSDRYFFITVRPEKWQKGMTSFFTDQTGVIRWAKEDRAPTAKDLAID